MTNFVPMHEHRIAIIGAGAAGCFLAQRLRQLSPHLHCVLFEASPLPLKKVGLSGGGRCNLTNSFRSVSELAEVYPRGHRLMKKLMYSWNQRDTFSWFEGQGVRLVVQDDDCVFPKSQRAAEIVAVLRQGLDIRCGRKVSLEDLSGYDAVVVATGGSRNFEWLSRHGIEIVHPVPSLFPFRLEPSGLEALSGILVEEAVVSIAGTSFRAKGTLLITHNGLSGPCILRLSSYAARFLAEHQYAANMVVNWLGETSSEDALRLLRELASQGAQKQVVNSRPQVLTSRLWEFLLSRAGLQHDIRWGGVAPRVFNRLASVLTSDLYTIQGRVPHKEEFVTAGGVSLRAVNTSTLECKSIPSLFFAGEVLDVDGVTGGFNLQAAWTMADTVARTLAERY